MDPSIILLIARIVLFTLAVLLFLLKYRYVQQSKARIRNIDGRWILWYDSMEIIGTSSQTRRAFMQKHNKLSTIMWICVLVGIILIFIPY